MVRPINRSCAPRVVVILAALFSPKGSSYRLLSLAAQGKLEIYSSPALLDELKGILVRDFKASEQEALGAEAKLLVFLKITQPKRRISKSADPDDDKVLECADSAGADFIASWDPHLLVLKRFEKIGITNPGKLLELLESATAKK